MERPYVDTGTSISRPQTAKVDPLSRGLAMQRPPNAWKSEPPRVEPNAEIEINVKNANDNEVKSSIETAASQHSKNQTGNSAMKILHLRKFGILATALQAIFIALFAAFVRYGDEADSVMASEGNRSNKNAMVQLDNYYPMFQDIHVMMFIGFGFLMTFLKRYGYSAVGINFILAAFVLQWAMLVEGFFHMENGYIKINITQMISSDFAAAAVLISMGALLGKLSPEQYIVMGLLEVALYATNEHILFQLWQVSDAGGSMSIHAFGAYFGLTVALVMYKENSIGHAKESSSYDSNLFSMIGTIFLWMYWPSFNGGMLQGDQRHRAVLNTYLSLAACCLVTATVSTFVNKENKFDMVHIQNSTLAGGVVIGTSANLMISPFGAMLAGSLAAVTSVLGYKYLTPLLAQKFRLHDTCGVNNLHGLPAITSAIIAAMLCGFASTDTYGKGLFDVLPALKNGRTSWQQAGYQLAGLGVTLALAIGGGLIAGLILRFPIWLQLNELSYFDDNEFWELPILDCAQLEQGNLPKSNPNLDENAKSEMIRSDKC